MRVTGPVRQGVTTNSDKSSTNLVGMKCMPCEKYAKADMPVRLSGALANYPIILSDSCTIVEEPTALIQVLPCTRLMRLDQSP